MCKEENNEKIICEIRQHEVPSVIVHNGVKVCKECVKRLKIWLIIPDDVLRNAGWIE